jgi:5-methylcytosine-specific restriction endonuclease McrA
MAAVCPYQIHTVIVKPPPKPKPEKCKRCGARHYPDRGVSQLFCDAKDEFEKLMQPWDSEGSKQSIWPSDSSYERYRVMLWPWIAGRIFERDKWICQDCGLETGTYQFDGQPLRHTTTAKVGGIEIGFEVHHIIPKGLGGSDHPANLKLVCQNCHKKYNEQFNGQIISKKAQERKTKELRKSIPKSLEQFEAGP